MTAKEEEYDYLVKLVLLGDECVGKSNLLYRFSRNEFIHDSMATRSIEFGTKIIVIDDKTVKAQIWDTCGLHSHMVITSAYLKVAKGILLVYNISQRKTFENIELWLQLVKDYAPLDTPIMLVGNRSDLSHKRAVPVAEGLTFAQANNLSFIETSALNCDGVDEAFRSVLTAICRIETRPVQINNSTKNEQSINKVTNRENEPQSILQYLQQSNPTVLEIENCIRRYGNNVNEISDDVGRTPLILAAMGGHVEVLKYLIESCKANVNKTCKSNHSAIYYSITANKWDCVKVLLEFDAHITKEETKSCLGSDTRKPLHTHPLFKTICSLLLFKFSSRGIKECLELLMGKTDINKIDKNGWSAVMYASVNNHFDCIELLLQDRVVMNDIQSTTILLRCSHIGHVNCVKELIKRNVRLNHFDENGWTALMYSVHNGLFELVSLLIEHGANVNLTNEKGYSSLIIATQRCDMTVIELLLNGGVDVNYVDKEGKTALMHNAANNENQYEILSVLLKHGADANLADNNGDSSLILYSYEGHKDFLELLLNNGSLINHVNQQNQSPTSVCIRKCYWDCVTLLLQRGANTTEEEIERIVVGCCEIGNSNCLEELFKRDVTWRYINTTASLRSYHGHIKDHFVLLLKHGVNVNAPILLDVFAWMCFRNEEYYIQLFLDHGVNVNLEPKDGVSFFLKACQNGNFEQVKLFLKYGADVNQSDEEGCTALILASKAGHVEAVNDLLQHGANVNQVTKDNVSALHYAFIEGHFNCVTCLLSYGSDVNIRPIVQDVKGESAFMIACGKNDQKEIQLFLDHGADVNELGRDNLSVFMKACHRRDFKTVRLFLNYNANVDQVDEDGNSALILSREASDTTCTITALLDKRANTNIINKLHETALSLAVWENNEPIVDLLIEVGAEVNFKSDKDGYTILMTACIYATVDTCKRLLDAGARMEDINEFGETALMLACQHNKTLAIELLLEKSANVNHVDNNLKSVLMIGCQKCNGEIVAKLLKAGAQVNAVDKEGNSALYYAYTSRRYENVELLLQYDLLVTDHDKQELRNYATDICNDKKSEVILGLFLNNLLGTRTVVDSLTSAHPLSVIDYSRGHTPLHYAFIWKKTPFQIARVIEAYPAALTANYFGHSPQYYMDAENLELVWYLLHRFPELSTKLDLMDHDIMMKALEVVKRVYLYAHIHLCGHGHAGKTTCRDALMLALKNKDFVSFLLAGSHKHISVDRNSVQGKTIGMELLSVQSKHHKWLIHDYGGQADFHSNHARFLSVVDSVYVIVVALWDAEKEKKFSLDDIRDRYLYWLKFLYSISEGTIICVTVVNFANKVSKQEVNDALNEVKTIQNEWTSDPKTSRVKFIGETTVINLQNSGEVRSKLTGLILNAVEESELIAAPQTNYQIHIENSLANFVSSNVDLKLIRRSEFVINVCKPAVSAVIGLQAIDMRKHDNAQKTTLEIRMQEFLCDKMIEYLCLSGFIMIVSTDSTTDPLIILDINWLAKELLGKLTDRISDPKEELHMLSASQIDEFTDGGSKYFGSVDGLVDFLQGIGACILLHGDEGEKKRWFPVCGQRKYDVDKECMLVKIDRDAMTNRRVVRRFKLPQPSVQMFPPGYFTSLFLKIISLFSIVKASSVKVYINGMELLSELPNLTVQVIITIDNSNSSFTLFVSSLSRTKGSLQSGFSECWNRFTSIRNIIMNTEVEVKENKFLRSTPWFDHLHLEEVLVNPSYPFGSKTVVELSEFDDSVKNKYTYGIDELLMGVNENDPTLNIFGQLLKGNADIQESLESLKVRFDMVTQDVSGVLVIDNLSAILKEMEKSDAKLIKIIENVVVQIKSDMEQQNAINSVEMNAMISKLQSESMQQPNQKVFKQLEDIQKSLNSLSSDVNAIHQIDNETVKTAILEALEQSTIINRVDTMLKTVVAGIHDIPTMVVVIPSESTMTSRIFDPRNWTHNEYRLFFICSHTLQVVPCGPKGNGFVIRKPRDWFAKVAPVVKTCLMVAKIALTNSDSYSRCCGYFGC